MPASSFVRDTAFGQIARLLTNNRWPQYPEERDKDSWKKYVNERKSGYMARYGTLTPPEGVDSQAEARPDDLENPHFGGVRTRDAAAASEKEKRGSDSSSDGDFPDDGTHNIASGFKIHPEKGRDIHLVDWLENDPEVLSLPCCRRCQD
jgi:MFS transporter, DHA1 family, multidrug resistance protein